MPNLKQMSKGANLLSLDSQSYGSNSARGNTEEAQREGGIIVERPESLGRTSTDILLTKMEGGKVEG